MNPDIIQTYGFGELEDSAAEAGALRTAVARRAMAEILANMVMEMMLDVKESKVFDYNCRIAGSKKARMMFVVLDERVLDSMQLTSDVLLLYLRIEHWTCS